MKSRFLLLAAGVLMLASCTMQQRVHQPGWYIQFNGLSKKHDKVENPTVNYAQVELPQIEDNRASVSPEVMVDEKSVIIESTRAASAVSTPEVKSTAKLPSTPSKEALKFSTMAEVNKEVSAIHKQVLTPLYKSTSGASTDQILLVILALLLPPLALYLFEGTSTLFWVTLILCLFSGGFLFAPFFGSFWFIAALLAVLRILKVI
jgi:uncharacterized membrane protein YqaE (UPF0057 family)